MYTSQSRNITWSAVKWLKENFNNTHVYIKFHSKRIKMALECCFVLYGKPWVMPVTFLHFRSLMPSSHLPRALCDKFVYDFPCNFLGIIGGYGLRHMCSHCLRASCNFLYGASGATLGKSVQRLCGDCTEIMQCQCSCRPVSAASAQKSYGARAGIGLRTVPLWGLCNATYDMSTGYGLMNFQNL